MKKGLKFFLLTLCLSITSLTPKKSDALILGPLASPMMVRTVTLVMMLGGPATGVFFSDQRPQSMAIWVGAFALVGLVLLDEKNPSSMRYSLLNENDAKKLNITKEQLTSYNSELDELNSVGQTIVSDIVKETADVKIKNNSQYQKLVHDLTQSANAAWKKIEVSGALSAQTMEVVKAIRSQTLH